MRKSLNLPLLLRLIWVWGLIAGISFAQPSTLPLFQTNDPFPKTVNYEVPKSFLAEIQDYFQEKDQHFGNVQATKKLVRTYEAQGLRAKQYQAIQDGLAYGTQHLPADASVLGSLHMMLGEYLMGEGDASGSLKELHTGLRILRQSDDYEDLTWCCYDLFTIHYHLGNLDSARHYVELGEATSQAHLPPEHEAHPSFLDNRTMLYTKEGQYDKGLESATESARLKETYFKATAWDSIELGSTYNNIASTHYLKGDFPKAIPYFQRALALIQPNSLEMQVDAGKILNNLGVAYLSQGKVKASTYNLLLAHQYLTQPQNAFTAKETGFNLVNLISHYRKQNKIDSAQIFMREAIEIGTTWDINLDLVYREAADLFLSLEDLDSAQHYFRLTIEKLDNTGMDQDVAAAQTYQSLAQIAHQSGQPDSALFYLQKSIDDFAYGFESSPVAEQPPADGYFPDWRILNALAMKGQILHDRWRAQPADTSLLRRAQETFLTGIAIFQQFRSSYETVGSKLDLTETGLPLFEGGILTYLDLFERSKNEAYVAKAFQLAEQCKGIAILEAQWEAQAKGSTLIPDSLREEERQLNLDLAFYRKKIHTEGSKGANMDSLKLQTWNNLIFEREKALETWVEKVQLAYPGYLNFRERTAEITPEAVQKSLLSPGEGLVEYFVGQQELIAFYIDEQSLLAYRKAKPQDLDSQVGQFYRCLSDLPYLLDSTAQNFAQLTQHGNSLYQLTLESILAQHPTISKLLIVSDGILHLVPFETLLSHPVDPNRLDFTALPYLLYQYRIRYGYSATLLLEANQRKREPKNEGLLAFAPSYPGADLLVTRGDFTQLRNQEGNLPGALQEVQTIAKLGLAGQYFYGTEAQEAQFKQLAQDYPILHLAMHGTANETNPLYSYLSFGETSSDQGEDENLYAYELQSLALNSELTVLSACESGWGKLHPGEGVMSLGRSFMTSGTRSVLMTLWKIEDQSSASLMEKFYQELDRGETSSEALHLAKQAFLKEADSRTAHPFYWSGFVVQGDATPLPASHLGWWIGLGSAFAIGGSFLLFRFRKQKNAA